MRKPDHDSVRLQSLRRVEIAARSTFAHSFDIAETNAPRQSEDWRRALRVPAFLKAGLQHTETLLRSKLSI
jgi:hypothetical protein